MYKIIDNRIAKAHILHPLVGGRYVDVGTAGTHVTGYPVAYPVTGNRAPTHPGSALGASKAFPAHRALCNLWVDRHGRDMHSRAMIQHPRDDRL